MVLDRLSFFFGTVEKHYGMADEGERIKNG